MADTAPKVVVGALVFNQERKIFLAQSPKWKNQWVIPGGHVEFGETLEQALIRETKEETNIDITDISFICVYEHVLSKDFIKRAHFIGVEYACITKGEVDVKLNEEFGDYAWIEIGSAEYKKLALYSGAQYVIEQWKKQQHD